MKKILLLAVIGLIVLLNFDYLESQDKKMEVYKPEVIIDAILTHDDELGAMPGNFVRYVGVDWIGKVSPSDIEVDDEGNIYIFDMGNDRIQKFNKDGQYVESISVKDCYEQDFRSYQYPLPRYKKEFEIDKEGNFYILESGTTEDRGEEIIKIDKKGNEIERFDISFLKEAHPEIFYSDGIRDMKLDEQGIPYFDSYYYDEALKEHKIKEIVKVDKGKKIVKAIDQEKIHNISKMIKGKKYEIEKISKKERIIKQIVNNKITCKINLKASWLHILGEDLYGNLFVSVDNAVYKYSKDNELIATMSTLDYWWGKKGIMPLKYNMVVSQFIDNNGNVYLARLIPKENKLQVIRWSKIEE